MRCPKCGAETPGNPKVCMMCGEPLSGTKICKNCGAIIPRSAVFCPECTFRQNEVTNVISQNKKKAKIDSAWWKIGAGIVAVFVLMIAFKSMFSTSHEPDRYTSTQPAADHSYPNNHIDAEEPEPPIESEHIQPDPSESVQNETPVTFVSSGSQIVDDDDNPDHIWANAFTPINDFYYSLDKSNRTITLNKYKEFGKKIMLSPVYTIDGVDYSLKRVGDACFFGKVSITSVYIPEGVTSIEDNSFNSCADLQYLYLPSTLTSITGAFLDYLDDYNIYCDSSSYLPESRDTNDYEEIIDNRSEAQELGESAAGALNGLVSGFFDGLNGTTTTTEIYFGGTESQWKAIRK